MVTQTVTNETAANAAKEPAVTPESVVESVRALRAQIPNYVQLPIPTVRTLVSVSSLNPEFTQAAIHAVGASQTVQATVGQTAEELQAAVETTARWTMVRDELKATLDGVNSAVLTMKHSLGQSILLTSTVRKNRVKVPRQAHRHPHVPRLRKTNRLGRSRKTQTPVPAPPPAPHV